MAAQMLGGNPVTVFRLEEHNNNNKEKNKNMNISKSTPQSSGFPSFLLPNHLGSSNQRNNQKPEPSCVVCLGSGRVDCHDCCGKGRRNHVDSEMLPRGEWPKWCRTCGEVD